MKQSRNWLLLAILGVFVLGLAHEAIAVPWANAIAEIKLNALQKLQKERKFAQLEKESASFVAWCKGMEPKYKLEKFILTGFDLQAGAQEQQGKYNAAANTVRASHSYKPNSANIDRVFKYEQKDLAQRDFFNKTTTFQNQRLDIYNSIYKLAAEKNNAIKALLNSKKKITKEDFEKLQAKVKELNAEIQKQYAKLKEVTATFSKETEQYRKDGIIFTTAQATRVNSLVKSVNDVASKVTVVQTEAAKNLVKAAEKYQMSWDGLEEKLTKMKEVQDKIMGLQKELLALLEKKPLSDDDKKKINDLKADLDKQIAAHDKLLADLENAFMDSKTFNGMSIDEQRKYMALFQVIRDADNVIDKTLAKINGLIKEMNFKFGDLNSDGKIDKQDLAQMLKLVAFPIAPFFRPPAVYNKAADLDGDGKVTWADYNYLAEAVNGARKFFPVDPAAPKGDLDGNGLFDNNDLYKIAQIMMNPKQYVASLVKLADINGDGKVDYNDISELIKKIQEQNKPVAPAGQQASATADVAGQQASATADVVGGDGAATGEVQANDQAPQQDAAPASTMNSAY